MIGYLKGDVLYKTQQGVVLSVHDVGYLVRVNEKTSEQLTLGTEAELFIHTLVRDETIELYGFPSQQELTFFHMLLTVNGVGPKSALGILNIGVGACKDAIQHAETTIFSSVPRLGKKTAQKIIIELQPKLGEIEVLELGEAHTDIQQAIQALVDMGYDKHTVIETARKLPNDITSLEETIKQLMKQLGKNHATT